MSRRVQRRRARARASSAARAGARRWRCRWRWRSPARRPPAKARRCPWRRPGASGSGSSSTIGMDFGRAVEHARDLVVGQRRGGEPALLVPVHRLGEGVAHALDEPALDLALAAHRVDGAADVVRAPGAPHLDRAGGLVDVDLDAVRAERVDAEVRERELVDRRRASDRSPGRRRRSRASPRSGRPRGTASACAISLNVTAFGTPLQPDRAARAQLQIGRRALHHLAPRARSILSRISTVATATARPVM